MERVELIDRIISGLEEANGAELRPVQQEAISMVLRMTDEQVHEMLRRVEVT